MGEQLGEVADLAVGPPWCPRGDGRHLVDGELAVAERFHAVGELGDSAGDGGDQTGALRCQPDTPLQEQLDGVDAFVGPALLVVEQCDGQVDEAGVLGVEVAGHFVERRVDVEGVLRFDRPVANCECHAAKIAHTYDKSNNNIHMFVDGRDVRHDPADSSTFPAGFRTRGARGSHAGRTRARDGRCRGAEGCGARHPVTSRSTGPGGDRVRVRRRG